MPWPLPIPGARFVEVDGAEHSPFFEVPDTFNAIVLAFLGNSPSLPSEPALPKSAALSGGLAGAHRTDDSGIETGSGMSTGRRTSDPPKRSKRMAFDARVLASVPG